MLIVVGEKNQMWEIKEDFKNEKEKEKEKYV